MNLRRRMRENKATPSMYTSILIALLLAQLATAFVANPTANTRSVKVFGLIPSNIRHGRPSQINRRPKKNHALSMSSSVGSEKRVIYQRIVRSPKDCPPVLLLGNLVEYLEEQFEIPPNLPMVYEVVSSGDNESPFALSLDSPLSSSSEATKLNVEVIGIYTEDDEDDPSPLQSIPTMAMIAVSKEASSPGGPVAPMMQNLFDDSEKRIIDALDRGMDDFCNGKIKLSTTSSFPEEEDMLSRPANVKDVEEAIQAELVDAIPDQKERVGIAAEDVIVEAETVPDEPAKEPSSKVYSSSSESDFAVQAAKRAAALKAMNNKANGVNSHAFEKVPAEDFAVQAAKKLAEAKKATNGKSIPKTNDIPVSVQKNTPKTVVKQRTGKVPSSPVRPRKSRFKTTISIPSKKRKANAQTRDSNGVTADVKNVKSVKGARIDQAIRDRKVPKKSSSVNTQRKLNLRVSESEELDDLMQLEDDEISSEQMFREVQETTSKQSKSAKTVSKKQMERDVMDATQKVMSELASQSKDLTPEELLEDVLKFGEEKDKEDSQGFVSGAFEQAKTLLQEQKQKREERLQQASFKEPDEIKMSPDVAESPGSVKELSAEEELKQIFEAGERLADSRMEITFSDTEKELAAERPGTTGEDIDRLIASEKSISGYARQLDDELAELELQITSTPGEELDGPRQNPIFDVFSGPEVYNPNVDPETAVNWPGALPGTKDVRLPKELSEAVSQAQFAADVLSKLKEEDGKFFVGEKEIAQRQVQNLQNVVDDATRVGLINDPLEYIAEQSRLQMLVDELTGQPEERIQDVVSNYKDLLLSENLIDLVKERLTDMAGRDLDARRRGDESLNEAHASERVILGNLVNQAQILLKEARALGAELEASQLEIVRQICQVAMDPAHKTEEETSNALTDAVRDMRPMFDDMFVAYLKYAIAEEEGRLARAGLLDDPEHNQWLFVLKIVQQGVYAELATGINRYIDHLWYVLRMETNRERRALLARLIDDLPTMDVRPFVQVVDNIVSALGDTARGDFDPALGDMTNKLLQLHRDVHELLPPDRIKLMSRDADEWAAQQKKKLMEQRKVTQQRLKAARETQEYDEEFTRRGETERMT